MDAAPAQLCAHRPAEVLRHFADLLGLGGGAGGTAGGVKWAPQRLLPVLEAAERFTGVMEGGAGAAREAAAKGEEEGEEEWTWGASSTPSPSELICSHNRHAPLWKPPNCVHTHTTPNTRVRLPPRRHRRALAAGAPALLRPRRPSARRRAGLLGGWGLRLGRHRHRGPRRGAPDGGARPPQRRPRTACPCLERSLLHPCGARLNSLAA